MRLDFNKYQEVFTPGAPVSNRQFLFGREQEIIDLDRALERKGFHPIVIGARGVGKTSLVQLALHQKDYSTIKITCNDHMTYNSFAHSLLSLIDIDAHSVEITSGQELFIDGKVKLLGFGFNAATKETSSVKRKGVADTYIDPWMLFRKISEVKRKLVIVIDEYDAILTCKSEFHSGIASLIKALADNSNICDSRIVVVGIARSAEDLLGKHESIERSARETFLRPLRREDVSDFLCKAEETLDFQFCKEVKDKLIWSSMGYPYFVHLVGLVCLDIMHDEDKSLRLVTYEHYERGIKKAINMAFRSQLKRYKDTFRDLHKEEKEILRELASLAEEKTVRRSFLRNRMKVYYGINEQLFNTSLLRLQQEKQVIYLSRNKDDIRFVDPLLAPFIRGVILGKTKAKPGSSDNQMSLELDIEDDG